MDERVVCLVDYENIADEAVLSGKIINFHELVALARSYGRLAGTYVFVPDHRLKDEVVWRARKQGCVIISTGSQFQDRAKQYLTADTIMIDFGISMAVAMQKLDKIVVVSHDGDFVTLINHAKNEGVEVIVVAGEKIAGVLREVADVIRDLPFES